MSTAKTIAKGLFLFLAYCYLGPTIFAFFAALVMFLLDGPVMTGGPFLALIGIGCIAVICQDISHILLRKAFLPRLNEGAPDERS